MFDGGTKPVSAGNAALSDGVPTALSPGQYYWQATYSGNASSANGPGNLAGASGCGSEVLTVSPAAVGVAGIIFVGGNILINAGFNTSGVVLVTSQITNATVLASASRKARCKAGQVLLKVGNNKKCVSNSFGTTTTSIPTPGGYKLTLTPNAAARRALKKGKTLDVTVTLTFKPTSGGKPVVTTRKITIKGKKH
ncbi:MAG: hypothetical protein ACYDHH_22225 [Solirubrobacteraceae bacterium]